MTTDTGALLRTGNIKDYTPLGEEGNPVYKWADQIRVTIKRKISAESINVFAIPQPNEKGDIVDWYAPESGPVIPWSSATREEKISAKEQLTGIQQQLTEIENLNKNDNSGQSVFKRLLVHVIQFPGDEHVYLVNGKPVLTFWGFVDADASIRPDPLAVLTIPELPGVVETSPVHAPEAAVVKRGFSWWWLLALIPLLLLLFFLLRGCKPPVEIDAMGVDPQVDYDIPRVITPEHGMDTYISSREGGVAPAVVDEPLAENSMPADEEETSEEKQDSEEKQEPPKPEPEQNPEPEHKPESEDTQKGEPEKNPENPQPEHENPPLQALEIPDNSEQQKSMDFLNGHWQADSGLMDKQGRPVKLEYDFKEGKGHVRIKKTDGTVCSGTVEASMKGKELSFSDNEVIKCPGGKSYQPAKVKCKVSDTNQTICEGTYSSGESFNMNINKAE